MMNRAARIIYPVCILVVLGFFIGCGDDDPVSVKKDPPPPIVPTMGIIGVYVNDDGTDLNVIDTGGTVRLFVVHHVTQGATASAFKIDAPSGWVLLGANAQFPLVLGDIDDGISVAYGGCLPGPIHMLTLTYQSPGNTTPGSTFKVVAHPLWPEAIQVVDCSNNLLYGSGMESPVSLP